MKKTLQKWRYEFPGYGVSYKMDQIVIFWVVNGFKKSFKLFGKAMNHNEVGNLYLSTWGGGRQNLIFLFVLK